MLWFGCYRLLEHLPTFVYGSEHEKEQHWWEDVPMREHLHIETIPKVYIVPSEGAESL